MLAWSVSLQSDANKLPTEVESPTENQTLDNWDPNDPRQYGISQYDVI